MVRFLIWRNLKVYIRDKGAIFFSLLGIVIIILLYIFFLGNALEAQMKGVKYAKQLIDAYIMSGVLCVSTVTTTLGAYGILIADRVNHKSRELHVLPVRSFTLMMGYYLAAVVIGFSIVSGCFILAQVYIYIRGGMIFCLEDWGRILFILLISVLNSGSFSFFLVSLIKSHGAYSGLNVVVGTLIGFVTGIYIPIGSLSTKMQWIVKRFPVSFSGVMLRKRFMEPIVEKAFDGMPYSQADLFRENMGMILKYGDKYLKESDALLLLYICTILFFGAGMVVFTRKGQSE